MADRVSFQDQISRNKFKSYLLIGIVFLVLIALGYVIGMVMGPDYFLIIMVFAIIFSLGYILISYYNSDKIALASVHAKPATPEKYPKFNHLVEGLCIASGMPKPRLYIMEDSNINAFASGRDPQHSVICVTKGTLEKLNRQELEGVLAHELSHIANFDIRFMTLTAVLVGMVAIISQIFIRSLWWSSISGRGGGNSKNDQSKLIFMAIGIVLAILAPIVVTLVQLSISRKREFTADASAVKFMRTPTGLKNALKKISGENPSSESKKKYNKAVAPLFISDPFKRKINGMFATHPPIKKRIEVLERM